MQQSYLSYLSELGNRFNDIPLTSTLEFSSVYEHTMFEDVQWKIGIINVPFSSSVRTIPYEEKMTQQTVQEGDCSHNPNVPILVCLYY